MLTKVYHHIRYLVVIDPKYTDEKYIPDQKPDIDKIYALTLLSNSNQKVLVIDTKFKKLYKNYDCQKQELKDKFDLVREVINMIVRLITKFDYI